MSFTYKLRCSKHADVLRDYVFVVNFLMKQNTEHSLPSMLITTENIFGWVLQLRFVSMKLATWIIPLKENRPFQKKLQFFNFKNLTRLLSIYETIVCFRRETIRL